MELLDVVSYHIKLTGGKSEGARTRLVIYNWHQANPLPRCFTLLRLMSFLSADV
jgi:hypothetical protein